MVPIEYKTEYAKALLTEPDPFKAALSLFPENDFDRSRNALWVACNWGKRNAIGHFVDKALVALMDQHAKEQEYESAGLDEYDRFLRENLRNLAMHAPDAKDRVKALEVLARIVGKLDGEAAPSARVPSIIKLIGAEKPPAEEAEEGGADA